MAARHARTAHLVEQLVIPRRTPNGPNVAGMEILHHGTGHQSRNSKAQHLTLSSHHWSHSNSRLGGFRRVRQIARLSHVR
jgi:hypothetical protein